VVSPSVLKPEEGFVNVMGFNLFYRSFGTPDKGTVLCLHGGPGSAHDYMLSMADLAKDGYRVVFYNQLGSWKSDVPKNTTLFVAERYVEEVEAFRKKMKLGRPHVIGSSWGGMLAIMYAIKYQRNMRSLTTVGGLHSIPLTTREMQRMVKELPSDVQRTLAKYEAEGDYENPEYVEATMVFYKEHLCRLDPWPKELLQAHEHISHPVYYTMNGPNEFTIIGNLRYWDVTEDLAKIKVPTLVVTGKYDEISPKVGRELHRGISGSKFAVFPHSSHMPFLEERKAFMKLVSGFLDKH
jgi:proline iminopeptidase